MSRGTVTLLENQNGAYNSAFPDGDMPAGVSLLGGADHGDIVNIFSDGSVNFGTTTPIYHSELNGVFRHEGGAPLDWSEAWDQNSFVESTTGLRAANVGKKWKGVGVGRLSFGYLHDTLPPTSKKLYLSYHTKFGSNIYRSFICNVESSTGTLQGGTDRARGELATVTCSDASVITAYVTYHGGGFITLDTEPSAGSASVAKLQGATIVGNTSGFSATTGIGVSAIGSTKYNRFFHGGTVENPRTVVINSHTSGGTVDYDTWDSEGTLDDHIDMDLNGVHQDAIGQYQFHEIVCDLETGFFSWSVDGEEVANIPDLLTEGVLGTIGLRPLLVGLDLPGLNPPAFDPIDETLVGAIQEIDSLVFHNDSYRVVLTNNSIYADSTLFEVQPQTVWSENRVSITRNSGAITGGYYHVFSDNVLVTTIAAA